MDYTVKNAEKLPVETRVLIVQAMDLLDRVEEKMKKKGMDVDMTCRFQLKSDIRALEKAIMKADQKAPAAREAGALREAFLRLKTSAAGILGLQTD